MIFLFFVWCIVTTYVYTADNSSGSDVKNIIVKFPGAATVEVVQGRFPFLDNLSETSLTPGIVELKDDSGVNQEFLQELNKWIVPDVPVRHRIFSDLVPEGVLSSSVSKDFLNRLKKEDIFDIPVLFQSWLSTVNTLNMAAEISNKIKNDMWNAWGMILLTTPIPAKTNKTVSLPGNFEQSLASAIINLTFELKFDLKNEGSLGLVTNLLDIVQDKRTEPTLYKTCSKNSVSLLCNKDNVHTLVIVPSFSLNRYYAYKLADGKDDMHFFHGDVSHDGAYLITFLQNRGKKYIAWYKATKGIHNKIAEQIITQRLLLPDDVDMETARVAFEINGYTCYCVYTRASDRKVYVSTDAKSFQSVEHTSKVNKIPTSLMQKILDPWITKVLSGENLSNVCRGSMQVRPFFNKKQLHNDFFNAVGLNIRFRNFFPGQVACTGSSCTHYEVILLNGKRVLRRIDFDADTRVDSLLNFLNKKYEAIQNKTDYSIALYPNALAIAYVYTSDWKITSEKLQQKMGILYQYVDTDLKLLLNAQSNPFSINAVKYRLYTNYQSLLSSTRKIDIMDSIKYGLWRGAQIVGIGYVLYNIFKHTKSSLLPRLQPKS